MGQNREPRSWLTHLELVYSRQRCPNRAGWVARPFSKVCRESGHHMQEMETELSSVILDNHSAHDGPETKCKIWTGNPHGDMSVWAMPRCWNKQWVFYIIIKVNETKPKRDKWLHGSSVKHTKQQRKESVYRMRELFAHCPPNEGFIAIIHSIFIVCREFKKQDSNHTMSSCFEQSQAHEAQ